MRSMGRRDFFAKATGLGAAAWGLSRDGEAGAASLPNPVGYATLTWPKDQLPHALEVISAHGFRGVQFLGWVSESYAGDQRGGLEGPLKKLKLAPVALSTSRVEPRPGGPARDPAKMRAYADFWKAMGGDYLQMMDSGQPGGTYSDSEIHALGEQFNAMGKIASDAGLTLGYHPHFGTYGETREGLGRVLDATDPRYVKLIADVGHLALGGSDPAEVIRTYHDRLLFCHFKDVRKEIWEIAQKDRNQVRHQKCEFAEIGAGVVDFNSILSTIQRVGFKGWVVVELDPCKDLAGGPDAAVERNQLAMRKMGFAL